MLQTRRQQKHTHSPADLYQRNNLLQICVAYAFWTLIYVLDNYNNLLCKSFPTLVKYQILSICFVVFEHPFVIWEFHIKRWFFSKCIFFSLVFIGMQCLQLHALKTDFYKLFCFGTSHYVTSIFYVRKNSAWPGIYLVIIFNWPLQCFRMYNKN